MPTSFLSLPGELRQQIYAQVLLVPEYIDPFWAALNYNIVLTPGLLRCHPAIRHETASFFYGNNTFDLLTASPGDQAWFISQIGSFNASQIRHVRIYSPMFQILEPGKLRLDSSSEDRLSRLQQDVPNLTSITTELYSSDKLETQLAKEASPDGRREAMQVLQTYYGTWPLLRQITLELWENRLWRTEIRAQMQELGWSLKIAGHRHEFGVRSPDADWWGTYHGFEYYYDSYEPEWWYYQDHYTDWGDGYHFDDYESPDSWVDDMEEDEDSSDDSSSEP